METYLTYAATLVVGVILGYLGFRYQLIQGKVQIRRERLLKNIAIVEQLIAHLLELEYITYKLSKLMEMKDSIEEEIELIGREQVEIDTRLAEYESSSTFIDGELKKHVEKREQMVSEVDRKFDEIENGISSIEEKISSSENLGNSSDEVSEALNELSSSLNEASDSSKIISEKMRSKLDEIENKLAKSSKFLSPPQADGVLRNFSPSGTDFAQAQNPRSKPRGIL